MVKITASLVTYKNDLNDIRRAIESFLNTKLNVTLYIIDNSPETVIEKLCDDNRIYYIHNDDNVGFGAAHNIGIMKANELGSDYHLIINPDITYEAGVIEKILTFIDSNNEIGLVMPKVTYPDGSTQYLCKLLPTPFDLIIRRFIPVKWIRNKIDYNYEMRFTNYDKVIEVPYLSGCFMFIRSEVFQKVGVFDETFFMYLEDVDFSRRINKLYKTVFYPEAHITHNFEKGSFKSKKLLIYHIKSAFKYFNKYGWFNDKHRQKTNKRIKGQITN